MQAFSVAFVSTLLSLALCGVTLALEPDSRPTPTLSSGGLRKLQSLSEKWFVDDLEMNRDGNSHGDPFTLTSNHGLSGTPVLKLYASRSALESGDPAQACYANGGELWFETSEVGTQNGLETTSIDLTPNSNPFSWTFAIGRDIFNQPNVYDHTDHTVMFCVLFGLRDEDSGYLINWRELTFTLRFELNPSFSLDIGYEISAALCDGNSVPGMVVHEDGEAVPFCICNNDFPHTQINSFEDLQFQSSSQTFSSVSSGQLRQNVVDMGCAVLPTVTPGSPISVPTTASPESPSVPPNTSSPTTSLTVDPGSPSAAPTEATGQIQCCRIDTLLPGDFTNTGEPVFVSVTGSVILDVADGRRRRRVQASSSQEESWSSSPHVTQERQAFQAEITLNAESGAAALKGMLSCAGVAIVAAMTLLI